MHGPADPMIGTMWEADHARLPHVVIVGAGFGGLACARALNRLHRSNVPVRVTIIDRRNYHLFQPLLYQVATAGLSPSQIATPIRSIVRNCRNVQVLMARVTGVDWQARLVEADGRRIPYDYLVLATGARHAYFGKDAWERFAPGLKKVDDATAIRGRLLTAFEQAETAMDEAARRRLTTFVVVGGGPTGVELAGAIAELARHALRHDFRAIDPTTTRVILVQSASRLLPAFPESLSASARTGLERLGVEVMTGARVEQVDAEGVIVAGERIAAGNVLWAAGVMASPAAKWLGAAAEKDGRVRVDGQLRVPGRGDVFAIGDTAASDAWDGRAVPGLAPAAKQMGNHVAQAIAARIVRGPEPAPFRYRHMGSMATIGRGSAVAGFGPLKLTGSVAWFFWGAVHVLFLIGFRNRLAVLLDWLWSYVTFGSGARLITEARLPEPAPSRQAGL